MTVVFLVWQGPLGSCKRSILLVFLDFGPSFGPSAGV